MKENDVYRKMYFHMAAAAEEENENTGENLHKLD